MFKSNSKEKTSGIGIWGRTANQLQTTNGTTSPSYDCCNIPADAIPGGDGYIPPCCVEQYRKEEKQFSIAGSILGNRFPWKRVKKPS